jgi:hypothetical protein
MTLMVRDEVDIVAAMVEHHLAQGVDLIIATDNASIDGTREVLEKYAATGRVELHDYLEHDKRQYAIVTGMARRAYSVHGADWVINADADEFFVPMDRRLSLRDAFEGLPASLGSFRVPVVNMTGFPSRGGAGIGRLRWRDVRDEAILMETAGLHAQPTGDAIHVGSADVEVVQGNHYVNIPSNGEPDPAYAIEVLHFPWRSWGQFSSKVEISGMAYEANPNLRPSPRHHGMRDFRFLRAGVLEDFYIYRHPNLQDPAGSPLDPTQYVEDSHIWEALQQLSASGDALVQTELDKVLANDGSADDYPSSAWVQATLVVSQTLPLEMERTIALERVIGERNHAKASLKKANARVAELNRQVKRLKAEKSALQRRSPSYLASRLVARVRARFR